MCPYQERSELKDLPHTRKWLELALPVKEAVEEMMAKQRITLEERSEYTEKMNVVEQVNHLMRYPYVRQRIKEGRLSVMGWYYRIEKGEIHYYDLKQKRFIRIE